ncbi:DNA translocase FtsK 4TM domain-containing protein [Hydrogenimonas thermophila]|uniref:FtsK/SpoIIIE family DNA translocase n=1 Tax=Hydrogenimonas thermophila TaxID=223786 RepID=UPI00293740D6|nr:DNA translocase FtsK 4TM domain-containing protein [Hydrogenimonas thermophila]WOE71204.1 DNA translocase FtsK 4TM domain-containing protein [Hydrogenimonas thermophila]WOE73724.1 DNA translocase FtsK 4TM domain-containing protein [Hydrogenimonas thermophila]
MFRTAFLITVAICLIYGAISTVFPQSGIVGTFGTYIGTHNLRLFGYLGYVDFIFLTIALYKLHKLKSFKEFDFERFSAWVLFIFSLLILQALVVDKPQNGWIGESIVSFLHPFVGIAGVWLFWLMTITLSAIILWGDNILDKLSNLKRIKISSSTPSIIKVPKPAKEEIKNRKIKEETVEIEEDIEIEEPEIKVVADIDKKVIEEDKIVEETVDLEEEETNVPEIDNAIDNTIDKKDNKKNDKKEHASIEIVQEIEENKKLLEQIDIGEQEKPKNFKLPKLDFLQKPPKRTNEVNEAEIDAKISDLLEKLIKFKIEGDVVRTYAGPVVTTFEFKPAAHIKVSKILNLQDDLAMALKAQTIRIQAPVPGKDVVGIEIPNKEVETIYLREILEDNIFKKSKSPLTIALGKDIVGKPFVTDLKKLPHLLIAGTTGSGKSVGINAMILSLLYRNSPDQLRLMMIDPKMLEFSIYNDIPHLLTPVITQPKKAITALSNMVGEMERRYQLMSQTRTKNIETYNEKAKKENRDQLPYIVVVIDELADLMMTGGKDVEFSIARLAQMARASGIHLIVATQRPSVDVVTGLIKANLPSRISYRVGQKIDSKVILDSIGAESLLGRGDMLFTPPGGGGLIRLHAPWSSEEEIENIVEYLKAQRPVEYDEHFLIEGDSETESTGSVGTVDDIDPLFEEAKQIVLNDKKTSISYLQRRLQIGYNRAARIIEQLESMGIISAPNAKGHREIIG